MQNINNTECVKCVFFMGTKVPSSYIPSSYIQHSAYIAFTGLLIKSFQTSKLCSQLALTS
jgi:hypothetical protein